MPTPMGVGPYNPEAPMHVFRVPFECDGADCPTRLSALAVRSRNTKREAVIAESPEWKWEDLKCPKGHPIQKPQAR